MAASKTLSKNLLQMKFMQRTKEKIELEEEESKAAHLLDNVDTSSLPKRKQILIEPSFEVCCNLRFGRMSFKGQNKEIEALMEEKKRELMESTTYEEPAEVSNREMAKRYNELPEQQGLTNRYRKKAKRRHNYIKPAELN